VAFPERIEYRSRELQANYASLTSFHTGVSPAAEWSPGFSLNRCLHIREVIREGKQPPLDRNSTPTEKLNS
jgi:hypothetical protein